MVFGQSLYNQGRKKGGEILRDFSINLTKGKAHSPPRALLEPSRSIFGNVYGR